MAIQDQCPCGRYVRMVNTDEKASYRTGKGTTTHVFVTRPAFDGLCSKCAVMGVPDYVGLSPTGEQAKYMDNKKTHNARALEGMGL